MINPGIKSTRRRNIATIFNPNHFISVYDPAVCGGAGGRHWYRITGFISEDENRWIFKVELFCSETSYGDIEFYPKAVKRMVWFDRKKPMWKKRWIGKGEKPYVIPKRKIIGENWVATKDDKGKNMKIKEPIYKEVRHPCFLDHFRQIEYQKEQSATMVKFSMEDLKKEYGFGKWDIDAPYPPDPDWTEEDDKEALEFQLRRREIFRKLKEGRTVRDYDVDETTILHPGKPIVIDDVEAKKGKARELIKQIEEEERKAKLIEEEQNQDDD